MLIKYFKKDLKLELTPKALNYANSKGDRLRIYYYEDEDKNENGYGLEFKGKDFQFVTINLLSIYLENMSDIESE